MTRVSYDPKPSFTHSPATSSRGLRPERSKIEKNEAAGSGNGTPTVDGIVLRTYEVEFVLNFIWFKAKMPQMRIDKMLYKYEDVTWHVVYMMRTLPMFTHFLLQAFA